MKNKKYWVLAAMLVICTSVIWAVDKTDPQNSSQVTFISEKDTLKGLRGVEVVVGSLEPEIEKYGLTKQQLITDVELRLRQNGIRVLSEQEWLSTAGYPILYVSVLVNAHVEGRDDLPPIAAYYILLELRQTAFLERDMTKRCHVSTRSIGGLGVVWLSKSKEGIREVVKDYVDKFINDYLAVNPKE